MSDERGQIADRELEVSTVAASLGVSYNTVRRLMERRELRWTWRGTSRGYRVYESSVREFKRKRDEQAAGQCVA